MGVSMVERAYRAAVCLANKSGAFRLLATLIGGAFVAGGIYTTTQNAIANNSDRITKQETVIEKVIVAQHKTDREQAKDIKNLEKKISWIQGFLKQKLGDEE